MKLEIQMHMEQINHICCLIENGEAYIEEVKKYIPMLNQIINTILMYAQDKENNFNINEQFVLQVLKDIIYGIEYKDSVFLLDTLRYGLLEIYNYVEDSLQREEQDEQTSL